MKNLMKKMRSDSKTGREKHNSTKGRFGNIAVYTALAVISVTAVVMVLRSTAMLGPGMSSDAVSYVSVAEHLLAGKGYLDYNGAPYVHWPPLFPTILAVLGLAGIKPLDGARLVNAISFGVIIFSSGLIFLRSVRSRLLVIVGSVAILLCPTFLLVTVHAWTEPLFILLVLLFILSMVRFLKEQSIFALVLVGICAALCCLQRYAGVPLIFTGVVLVSLFVRNCTWARRLTYAVIFGAIASAPLCLWMVRNKIVASTAADFHREYGRNIFRVIEQVLMVTTPWFVPEKFSFIARLLIIGLVLSLLAAAVFFRRYKFGKRKFGDRMLGKVVVTFILIYCLFTFTAASLVNAIANERTMLPVYIFIVLFLLIALEDAVELLTLLLKKKPIALFIIAGLCSLWLLFYPLPAVREKISTYRRYGVPGYNSLYWNRSAVINWLKVHPLKGLIFSNEPHPVCFLTGLEARISLRRSDDIAEFKRVVSSEEKCYLVWYYGKEYWNRRRSVYDLQELNSMFKLRLLSKQRDGAIFIMN